MSGDSPSSHATETIFDFKEGRHSPIPTTSKDPTQQNFVTASVLVEPPPPPLPPKKEKDEEKEQDGCPLNSPIANNTSDVNDEHHGDEETLKLNDGGGGCGFDDNKRDDEKKLNGPDMLDGKWIPAQDAIKNEKEEEECAVKCLYYTMQCCECTIL